MQDKESIEQVVQMFLESSDESDLGFLLEILEENLGFNQIKEIFNKNKIAISSVMYDPNTFTPMRVAFFRDKGIQIYVNGNLGHKLNEYINHNEYYNQPRLFMNKI